MATISKQILSGSTQGTGIKLTDSASSVNTDPGYLIHTAVSGTDDIDEIWIWACNTNTSTVVLTVEFGGTDVDDNIKVAINPNETVLVVPGLPLQNGLLVKGFASVVDKVNVFGYANRIDLQ
tara:strand:+ start:20 stop:385 length:366 start_codon:yes stop_codon:yes gene_type:complete